MTDFSKIIVLDFQNDESGCKYLISEENPLFEDCKKRTRQSPQIIGLIKCIWVRSELYNNILEEFCRRENEKFQKETKLTNVQQKILEKFSDNCHKIIEEYYGQNICDELKGSIRYRLKSLVREFEKRKYFSYGSYDRFSFGFKCPNEYNEYYDENNQLINNKNVLNVIISIDGHEIGTHEYEKLLKQIVSMNFVYLKELDMFSPIQHNPDFSWYEDYLTRNIKKYNNEISDTEIL